MNEAPCALHMGTLSTVDLLRRQERADMGIDSLGICRRWCLRADGVGVSLRCAGMGRGWCWNGLEWVGGVFLGVGGVLEWAGDVLG